MQPNRFQINHCMFVLLLFLNSCNHELKNNKSTRECSKVILPKDASVREQFQLLPVTSLKITKKENQRLIKEIAIKNINEQTRYNIISDTSNLDRCFLISHKFKEIETRNSDSVYAVHLSSYKVIKLKSIYLILNYYQTELSLISYQPNNDSLTIEYLGALDSFIGSKEIKAGKTNYFTFAYKGSQMNIKEQRLFVLAYSNNSDEYKLTPLTINKIELGTHGNCDTLITNKYLIDYVRGLVTLPVIKDSIILN